MTSKQINNRRRGWMSKKEGEAFERIIENACAFYRQHGTAEIEKTPEPMRQLGAKDGRGQFRACYQKKAQPDFKGTIDGGRSVVFEAKHTDADRILQSVITSNQWRALSAHQKLGADAFVLVSIGLCEFFRIPWEDWKNMEELTGYKHMKRSDMDPYRISYHNGVLRFLERTEDVDSEV